MAGRSLACRKNVRTSNVFSRVPSGHQEMKVEIEFSILAAQLAVARGERAAERQRRLVVHADDDAVAVAHDAHRIFRCRQLVRIPLTPVHLPRSMRGV